jgi:plasmid maintenance system antidote protein VapI
MTYQKILAEKLSRRTSINPRYSLRAFAASLGLEASKLSEILMGKKGLSADRAEQIVSRLRLEGYERDLFILSVQAQHARAKSQRQIAAHKLKELLGSKKGERTTQKNAWYFGAVEAVRKAGFKVERLLAPLRLTALQIENAERFLRRIKQIHPARNRLSYEPLSLMKRITEDFSQGSMKELDAEFLFMSPAQAETLIQLIKSKLTEFKESKPESNSKLHMFFLGFSEILNREEIC